MILYIRDFVRTYPAISTIILLIVVVDCYQAFLAVAILYTLILCLYADGRPKLMWREGKRHALKAHTFFFGSEEAPLQVQHAHRRRRR